MIKLRACRLDGVMCFETEAFEDFRGRYREIYHRKIYDQLGAHVEFVQDDISRSSHGVLRGIHGDDKTWKLISCLYGSFYLVVVNNDPDSAQFLQWESFTLSDTNGLQVLVPPKFGNGHLVMSGEAIFHYKQSTYYQGAGAQFTILWNDPAFGIWWPIANPILSQRDQTGDASFVKS
ncbi:MAG: dTDP-4-dehydrorhamnose 3,5-epimerase [Patescibacteria group bacterium]